MSESVARSPSAIFEASETENALFGAKGDVSVGDCLRRRFFIRNVPCEKFLATLKS